MNRYGERLLMYRPPGISKFLLALAFLLNWLLPAGEPVLYSAPWLAFAVGSAGFGIMIWAWWLFREADTAICPTAGSTALVTAGAYRISRNPMYLGIVLMMLAAALWFGTWPFYAVTVIYFLVMDRVFCPYEEQDLARTFGEPFTNYCNRVRRWI